MSESHKSPLNTDDERVFTNPKGEESELLNPLERKLLALRPRDDRLNRERLLFLAGQASVIRTQSFARSPSRRLWEHWCWAPAFATMTAAAGSLLFLLLWRPAATVPHHPFPVESSLANNHRPAELDWELSHNRKTDRIEEALSDHRNRAQAGATAITRANQLSTASVLRGDVEPYLDLGSRSPTDGSGNAGKLVPVAPRHRSIITPGAWRAAFDLDAPAGLPDDGTL